MQIQRSWLLLLGLHLASLAKGATPVEYAPHPVALAPLMKRTESVQDFNEETTSLESQGLCRSYDRTDGRSGPELCYQKCGKLSGKSVSCIDFQPKGAPPEPSFVDPDGHIFHIAPCTCDIPFLDQIVTDVLMALPMIAEIGCEIFFKALDTVFEIGALAIPGVGAEMDAGMAAAVKGAKTISENGGDALSFLKWITNPCGNNEGTQAVDKYFDVFDPLSKTPKKVMDGNGCKKGPCPGPPKNSPARPTNAPTASWLASAAKSDPPKTSAPPASSKAPDSSKSPSLSSEASSQQPSSTHHSSSAHHSGDSTAVHHTHWSNSTSGHHAKTKSAHGTGSHTHASGSITLHGSTATKAHKTKTADAEDAMRRRDDGYRPRFWGLF